jgi:hypothetical protein
MEQESALNSDASRYVYVSTILYVGNLGNDQWVEEEGRTCYIINTLAMWSLFMCSKSFMKLLKYRSQISTYQ